MTTYNFWEGSNCYRDFCIANFMSCLYSDLPCDMAPAHLRFCMLLRVKIFKSMSVWMVPLM